MYFTYFYTRLRQSIWFFGSATNWAIAQLGNRFNFPTFNRDHSTTDGKEIMNHAGDDGKFVLVSL